jgi:hypothetical protein
MCFIPSQTLLHCCPHFHFIPACNLLHILPNGASLLPTLLFHSHMPLPEFNEMKFTLLNMTVT